MKTSCICKIVEKYSLLISPFSKNRQVQGLFGQVINILNKVFNNLRPNKNIQFVYIAFMYNKENFKWFNENFLVKTAYFIFTE